MDVGFDSCDAVSCGVASDEDGEDVDLVLFRCSSFLPLAEQVEYEKRNNAQMAFTTRPILSSSSGQMSGQFVNPNCTHWSAFLPPPSDARRETHIDQTPPPQQVLVREAPSVLGREDERSSDLGLANLCRRRLCPLPLCDLFLLLLEIPVQPCARQRKHRCGFEREGLRESGRVSNSATSDGREGYELRRRIWCARLASPRGFRRRWRRRRRRKGWVGWSRIGERRGGSKGGSGGSWYELFLVQCE